MQTVTKKGKSIRERPNSFFFLQEWSYLADTYAASDSNRTQNSGRSVCVVRRQRFKEVIALYFDNQTNYAEPFTAMRSTTTFRSTTDRIYDGGPIILL